jgi:hypothetical protein
LVISFVVKSENCVGWLPLAGKRRHFGLGDYFYMSKQKAP